jgi:hypothetical protein
VAFSGRLTSRTTAEMKKEGASVFVEIRAGDHLQHSE